MGLINFFATKTIEIHGGGSPIICLLPSRLLHCKSTTCALTKSVGTDQTIIFHQNYIKSATIIDTKPKENSSSMQSLLDRFTIIISVCQYLIHYEQNLALPNKLGECYH